jgi:hypothetical protein
MCCGAAGSYGFNVGPYLEYSGPFDYFLSLLPSLDIDTDPTTPTLRTTHTAEQRGRRCRSWPTPTIWQFVSDERAVRVASTNFVLPPIVIRLTTAATTTTKYDRLVVSGSLGRVPHREICERRHLCDVERCAEERQPSRSSRSTAFRSYALAARHGLPEGESAVVRSRSRLHATTDSTYRLAKSTCVVIDQYSEPAEGSRCLRR